MTACTSSRSVSIFWKIGSKKVCVFPEPVFDSPTKSRPERTIGINFSCTSVGFSNLIFSNVWLI